ncbi:CTP synthase [Mycoplasma phocoenae]|uniref:CTP synthase (glutamine hydrolyzing) n=1 Tax=Mycoplasma phocoenae TaxID=754517 RepID=A0A858U4W4_9MOLU|nr:CTP synthase [Mycoplasma phocoenae]QJG67091.1 CTP synthase [Mycoplasma phocoenae]
MKTKFIFVTGGVISGLGKGVSAASIGRLLRARNFDVFALKLDPYLNVDPGVLSPFEHGEVYVTNDGGETDLDLGHYERFIDQNLSKDSSVTSGKLFSYLIKNEREGMYNGKTVQIVPHFTDSIKNAILNIANKYNPDFAIVEIGGTVGDIESNSFFYAIAQLKYTMPNNVYFVHTSYVPFLEASKEFKSKPTQHSISILRELGINPNLVLLRSHNKVNNDIISKIANFSFIEKNSVISIPDFKQVYEMPLYLEEHNVCQTILSYFNLEQRNADLTNWKEFVNLISTKYEKDINLALVGKYVAYDDAYKSIIEALKISSAYQNVNLKIQWIDSETIKSIEDAKISIKNIDGVLILPGFGKRGIEGKILMANATRQLNTPTLGICLGMQVMCINQARLKGMINATSYEFKTENKDEIYVLDLIRGKNETDKMGGTLRLGASDTEIKPNTLAHNIYKEQLISERHRHRYEISPNYRSKIEDEEFIFSGQEPNSKLAEICELKNHSFYVGVQYHPEFNARPLRPHPLFNEFIKTIKKDK